MRGEEASELPALFSNLELPPHARRRGCRLFFRIWFLGITSACAEKSGVIAMGKKALEELPPHARRRALVVDDDVSISGITSACAEKRLASVDLDIPSWNYLRMRGEEKAHFIFCGIK